MNDEHTIVTLPDIPIRAEEFRYARRLIEQFAQRFSRHCRRAGIPAASLALEFEEAGETAGAPRYAVATVNIEDHPDYELRLEVRWRDEDDADRPGAEVVNLPTRGSEPEPDPAS